MSFILLKFHNHAFYINFGLTQTTYIPYSVSVKPSLHVKPNLHVYSLLGPYKYLNPISNRVFLNETLNVKCV